MALPSALLIGENTFPFHRLEHVADRIETALEGTVDVTTTTDRNRLIDLEEYDLLIDYLTDSTLTPAQLDGYTSFVANGGGYLGLHCASDLTSVHAGDGEIDVDGRDEPIPELRKLLGGHFLHHPEESTFGVEIVANHPVTEGIDDFEVFDEPYALEHDVESVTVLARMDHPQVDSPVVWVRSEGNGRVCYCSLGHTDEALTSEQFRRLIRNAAVWAIDGS